MGAGHLKIGDTIKQADGTTGLVANVTTVEQTREMFNLTVSEAHTYYVGQDGWLVHNTGSKPALPTATDLRTWAAKQGYKKSMSGNIEVWSDPQTGDWRLKIKPPSEHADIHEESKDFRYAAGNASGQYFDPMTGETGTRKSMGHLAFDPCDF
ncbi:polymorphic toxin-type HINT domain-containing protein [Deinococcus actinosclerus]|uniref:polymorphic toxin-type HINT domain-containing protein n=1 Tax=Deinococcus actinosclerus TaxID=1768108 RepID=UPI0009E7B6D7|nr:polymorphic toxin-type HINT domain-containing protein [Deinococcus actinosclerus]